MNAIRLQITWRYFCIQWMNIHKRHLTVMNHVKLSTTEAKQSNQHSWRICLKISHRDITGARCFAILYLHHNEHHIRTYANSCRLTDVCTTNSYYHSNKIWEREREVALHLLFDGCSNKSARTIVISISKWVVHWKMICIDIFRNGTDWLLIYNANWLIYPFAQITQML